MSSTLDGPAALAFDSSGNLYVANSGANSVIEFAPGVSTPSVTLAGLDAPNALAFDSHGDLFVANYNGNTVSEFAPGATTAMATLTGLGNPNALAFDSSGKLYVLNQGANTVSVFAADASTPSLTLAGLDQPQAMAVDSDGTVYVANAAVNTVSEFAPGATTATATLTSVYSITALVLDAHGDLFAGSRYGYETVEEYIPGATSPTTVLTGVDAPAAFAFDSQGNLYVANQGSTTVSEFAGATSPSTTLLGLSTPSALAFSPAGNLFVASDQSNSLTEFLLAGPPPEGGIVIQSSVESRPMLLGDTSGGPIAGINLSTAELAQLQPAADGILSIGDPLQTGNITFKAATPALAPLNVVESTVGGGGIILDDSSSGTALNGNGGAITLTPGTGGIQTTLYATGTPLTTSGFAASGSLNLSLGFAPTLGMQFTVVNNTATPAVSSPIDGTFTNLPQDGTVALNYQGTTYYFTANYQGGDGNDLVLTNVVALATQLVITTQPPSTVTAQSPFSITVAVEDAQGDVIPSFNGSQTVTIANNSGGSTLGGTLVVSAINGIATFSGLLLDKVGSGYLLVVNSSTLTAATSSAISVAPGAATQLILTSQPPSTVTAGTAFGFTVTAEDAEGNVVAGFSGSETLSLASGPLGGTLRRLIQRQCHQRHCHVLGFEPEPGGQRLHAGREQRYARVGHQ